jgi:bifunctional DNase/RNase
MIEVTVDSIRVSLISQNRVVVLKETDSERYLPIWIGPFEADAITIGLQGVDIPRPLTHDLLKDVIDKLGGDISHIFVNDLHDDTFFARIVMDVDGRHAEIDARPSDAIALAVRARVPIFIAESVMERAGQYPAQEQEEDEKLSVFREFIDTLDLDDLGEGKD